jgi:cytochrome b6-f complex iron-sulfur subunit
LTQGETTRREFCAQACHGSALALLAGSLGVSLQACASGSGGGPTGSGAGSALPVVNGTLTGSTVALTIDAASPLAAVGTAALVQTSGGSLLVAHTAPDTFVAVSARCTHQSCTISRFASQTYICPCHGSQFSTTGQVVSGPASVQLPQFQTLFNNPLLTIS